jgi:GT2 family glycosyltransferase
MFGDHDGLPGVSRTYADREVPAGGLAEQRGDSRIASRSVSVVVPCCGQLEYTRLCIPSLLRHSRAPYELIFVDVASLDGTTEYLAGVGTAARVPVTAVRIDRDVDFAAAYNAGIAQAHGEFIVLLNNDTIVTEGWLEHLVALADFDPQIGMVGAMSNHAAPPQWTGPVPYRLVTGDRSETSSGSASHAANLPVDAIDRFAREWREQHKKEWFETERLAGFCILLRRVAFEKIGPYVTPFPLGFSDEELSRRMRQTGYRLACCRDLFIHHFGSRSTARAPTALERGW